MHDAMSKLDGEAVEKEVASNVRTMHKTGKAFAQRGLQAYASNCDTIKGEIEEFQKVVPLLVVSTMSVSLYPLRQILAHTVLTLAISTIHPSPVTRTEKFMSLDAQTRMERYACLA